MFVGDVSFQPNRTGLPGIAPSGGRFDLAEYGVPPTQVAEWAGHSVSVFLRVYAKCVYVQEEVAKARIEAALAPTAAIGEPDVAVTSRPIPGEQP